MSSLTLSNITASYGKAPVVTGVSAAFAAGRLTVLAGPNGCGKSTLLRAIMGFLPDIRGDVSLDGQPVAKIGRRMLARRIAYLAQESSCPDYMTLGELVELGGYARYSLMGGPSDRDRQLFREALETVGLADKAHLPVNTLSGGQRQRAWIAMVLAQDTDIVLMDEPVNHLDVKYQYSVLSLVRALVRNHGKTVIMVLHDLNLAAAFADDIILMKAGRILASGPVPSTITSENVARVFDLEAEVFPREDRLVFLPRLPSSEAASP